MKLNAEQIFQILKSSQYANEKAFISRCFQLDVEKQFDKIKLRLHLIDSLYSTQMSKRYYGIEELAEAFSKYTDDELIVEAKNMLNKENSTILKNIFSNKYGYNSSGKNEKKAVSLISKYLYFLTGYQFPIYDSLVKIAYPKIKEEYQLKTKFTTITDVNFVKALAELNQISGIRNFEKLDNFLWYSEKERLGSYSLILSKEEHLKRISK